LGVEDRALLGSNPSAIPQTACPLVNANTKRKRRAKMLASFLENIPPDNNLTIIPDQKMIFLPD
jgi:hypothetical protein